MKSIRSVRPLLLALVIGLGLVAQSKTSHAAELESITVAGGCFWCVEADFEKVKGVKEAVSGYTGGAKANPTYKQVTKGGSGHYEAVKITYDPSVITRPQLYALFLRSVDVTDAGGQFCDRGESYRTAIFASGAAATDAANALSNAQAELGQKIVTPILAEAPFYPAEEYHQDYYKSSDLILTRFGPRTKSKAYKLYRNACGRDKRVKQLWGNAAAFTG
ncbi:MAG: peptide-methionine (S)-S-oxide reductase MsrA [Rhodobacteraceae bacterium]|nr:peptide-methionine (S)-S-oxide reductase MsrA [Paracoccaceae bacterium]